MRVSNDLDLPQPIVDAVRNDDYDPGDCDISVTRLISPPQKVYLEALHAEDRIEDASDRIFALMGQAIHTILERAKTEGIAEERLYASVAGWRIGGKFDYLSLAGVLQDYKVASVWEAIYGIKPERVEQLNVLAWLCKQYGYKVERLEAVFIFRDWSKTKAAVEENYPTKQVARLFVPLWDEDKVFDFIINRVRLHQAAAAGNVEPCSDEDRWARPTKYAVMRKDRVKAQRLLDTEEAALEWAAAKNLVVDGEKVYIEKRPGENVRCASYCGAMPWCGQFAAIKAAEAVA